MFVYGALTMGSGMPLKLDMLDVCLTFVLGVWTTVVEDELIPYNYINKTKYSI